LRRVEFTSVGLQAITRAHLFPNWGFLHKAGVLEKSASLRHRESDAEHKTFISQSRRVIAQSSTPSRIFSSNKTTANAIGRAKNALAAGMPWMGWDETFGRVNGRIQKTAV